MASTEELETIKTMNNKKDDNETNRTKKTNTENNKVILIPLVIGIILIGFICVYTYVKIQEQNEKFNNDIENCYNTIRNESDFSKFDSIIQEHTKETDFESKAYEQLFKAINERIEEIKNGKEDKDIIELLKKIQVYSADTEIKQKIENKSFEVEFYTELNTVNKYISEQKYREAYDLLEKLIKNTKIKNTEITNLAINKQNEIREQTLQQVIIQAQEKMNAQDYSSVKALLERYKDLGNQTILDMYNNATNEVNRIEAEKKAKEEAEKKAKEEAERQIRLAELNAKKDLLTINKNGKKIWKVCMKSNSFRFSAKFRGNGNFIVKLLDDNQNLQELLCNEIGDYDVNKTVKVKKDKYYYLEIYVSDGSWNGYWTGTYGD